MRPWRASARPRSASSIAAGDGHIERHELRVRRPRPRSPRSRPSGFSPPRAAATTVAPCRASIEGDPSPDPPRGAGDERHAIGQIHHRISRPSATRSQREQRLQPLPFSMLIAVTAGSIFLIKPAAPCPGPAPRTSARHRRSVDEPRLPSAPATRPADQRIDGARGVGLRQRVDVGHDRNATERWRPAPASSGSRRSSPELISGQWKGALTASAITRLAPRAFAIAPARATAAA